MEEYDKLVEKEALKEKPQRPSLVPIGAISAAFGLPQPSLSLPCDHSEETKSEDDPPSQ